MSAKAFIEIKNGDKVAIGGWNSNNYKGIKKLFDINGKDIDIVGGWKEAIDEKDLIDYKLVNESAADFFQKVPDGEQPQIVVFLTGSTNIIKDMENITKNEKNKIKVIFIISGYTNRVPLQEIKRVTILCRKLEIKIHTIDLKDVGYEIGYLLEDSRNMPWTIDTLDMDLLAYLQKNNLSSGSFLDLGTGSGTQAVKLFELGFDVTATDLVYAAFEETAKRNTNVHFLQDDILNTGLNKKFDYIFDRGCLHALGKPHYERYAEKVKSLLKEEGLLFLKYATNDNFHLTEDVLSYYYSENELNNFISRHFTIVEMKQSIFEEVEMKSIFSVLMKKATH
ncbi:hypothetical protein acsn021_24210 [Anaerocolumna cellulosilytica]|uniref:Uncharacterized protein n=1 Tax=Anaerocolumna cellulosilytica TaxID=433286 RepID=A0A6S6R5Y0_9FIRM|nr:class I SAM-dependent methyltransferase [Anaerocolumna cellulosilytica]MBB5193934.1 SAM-dependent methyltransferase [Anaerocolumna cellulosilytica]BCJ94852.1 hypothetical protein acsn021_24210 [Anaerocolumna cellulosilytica]